MPILSPELDPGHEDLVREVVQHVNGRFVASMYCEG
jgi:hypothetical protein